MALDDDIQISRTERVAGLLYEHSAKLRRSNHPKPFSFRLGPTKIVPKVPRASRIIRSASAGRDRRSDVQARYWGFLFENLRRAVDEIYQTCESDESVEECKETIMILESCTKDFHNLIEWLKLKWNYEKTPLPQRPTSLAWEVRKSSPSKPITNSSMIINPVRRILTFNEAEEEAPKLVKAVKNAANNEVQSKTVPKTWAQRLQKPVPPKKEVVPPPPVSAKKISDDGWETVRGRTRSRASPAKTASKPGTLMRSSTVIYCGSGNKKDGSGAKQRNRQPKMVKSKMAQSLPSLVKTAEVEKVEVMMAKNPTMKMSVEVMLDDSEEDEDGDEEAEMARREEALTAEEESLQREIRETERSDNEADEMLSWEEPINVTPASTPEGIPLDCTSPDLIPPISEEENRATIERDMLEEKYHQLLAGCSWAEQMDLLDQLQSLAEGNGSSQNSGGGARMPGRALQVHEKLSSPSRRRVVAEPDLAYEQHEAKQRRAREHRAALQEERGRKRRELSKRMDEVRVEKERLVLQKKMLLERKMTRAEEKRLKHLAEIVKKAHDEEEKKKEIAFINSMEAQNKRHDFIAHIQTQEERIQGLHEERARRQEERKLAKEAAVEERKRVLEAERQAKLAQLQEKRRRREERIDREQQEKEKERQELAREKRRDREERLSAIQAAHRASKCQLQQRILQKQEESARRHVENLEQIRQRALELSILRFSSAAGEDGEDEDLDQNGPPTDHYETERKCSLCGVAIQSEAVLMSHLRGKKHRDALRGHYGGKEPSREQSESSNLKFIVDSGIDSQVAPPENSISSVTIDSVEESEKEKREKMLKKRAKKLKSKLMPANGTSDSSSPISVDGSNRHRIARILQDLERDPQGHDRHWAELVRLLDKASTSSNNNEQLIFAAQRGVGVVCSLLSLNGSSSKILLAGLNALRLASKGQAAVALHVIHSRAAPVLLNFLAQRLESLNMDESRVSDPVAAAAMSTWVTLIQSVTSSDPKDLSRDSTTRLNSLISFAVALGLVDRLGQLIGDVRAPAEEDPVADELLLAALKFLTSLTDVMQHMNAEKKTNNSGAHSELLEAFKSTELAGIVNALYGLLLPSSGGVSKLLPESTLKFTLAALQLMHRLALIDLKTFQAILGADGVSLEFRHIASFLLSYGANSNESIQQHLLNLTIVCVGYFATNHPENQMILQSGHMPSVLQQLCRLPFGYFSDRPLRAVLLPTLLACCHDNLANRAILQKEMSYQMLDDFVNSDDGRSVHLVQLNLKLKK